MSDAKAIVRFTSSARKSIDIQQNPGESLRWQPFPPSARIAGPTSSGDGAP
jgi:hypothetical protein